jgi:hypothetical protein
MKQPTFRCISFRRSSQKPQIRLLMVNYLQQNFGVWIFFRNFAAAKADKCRFSNSFGFLS